MGPAVRIFCSFFLLLACLCSPPEAFPHLKVRRKPCTGGALKWQKCRWNIASGSRARLTRKHFGTSYDESFRKIFTFPPLHLSSKLFAIHLDQQSETLHEFALTVGAAVGVVKRGVTRLLLNAHADVGGFLCGCFRKASVEAVQAVLARAGEQLRHVLRLEELQQL